MKPGAIITPKDNIPGKARFVVRSKTPNGWVRCHACWRAVGGGIDFNGDHIFKFRAREMEVVG